jgi:hypothetical protein
MSNQATYTGRFAEAACLARAGRAGTTRMATASMTAHFFAMEARALALRDLGRAEELVADGPLDQAKALADRATPNVPIGRPPEAVPELWPS